MDLFNSAAFDARVNSLISDWPVPGIAIAIVQNDTIASKAFGWANIQNEVPFTTDTLCDMASTSKAMTAASVALLIDDNEAYPYVQWDATMSSLLPDDFVLSGNGYTDNVTVEDILSHRSGFPRHDFSYLGIRSEHPDTPRSVVRNLRNLEMAAPIRSKFLYSNIMYIVASFLVEQMSGLWFADYLKKHFFEPLGMNSTYLQPQAAIDAGMLDRIATPYDWRVGDDDYTLVKLIQVPEAQGCGSIFTSVNDHAKWVRAMMNQEPPISKSIYRGLLKPRIIDDDDDLERDDHTSPSFYTAGWSSIWYYGHNIMLHDGGVSGFGSFHFFLPGSKFGGVAVGNSPWAGTVGVRLSLELITEVLQTPKLSEFPDWSTASKLLREQDEEEARELREELCPGVEQPEPQKIPLGEYVGRYWNAGYHGMNVEVVNEKLFVNATGRSQGFTLTFEHFCDQTKYIAHMTDYFDGDTIKIAAEFTISNNQVLTMSLQLDWELDHLIRFDKQSKELYTDGTFALFNPGGRQVILTRNDGKRYRSRRRRSKAFSPM